MKIFLYSLFFALFIFSFWFLSAFHRNTYPGNKNAARYGSNHRPTDTEKSRITSKAAIVKEYLQGKKFNSQYCFLVDMNMPSGKNRFFVVDLSNDSIMLSGLVAHGHCKNGFCVTADFSNREQSCCTALGKYRIGNRYQGQYGLAYKLYGLDSTNSNAYARNIVLHAYYCVPEKETYPLPICNSSGCPMIASGFLEKLQPLVDKSRQPVLLWIFN